MPSELGDDNKVQPIINIKTAWVQAAFVIKLLLDTSSILLQTRRSTKSEVFLLKGNTSKLHF